MFLLQQKGIYNIRIVLLRARCINCFARGKARARAVLYIRCCQPGEVFMRQIARFTSAYLLTLSDSAR